MNKKNNDERLWPSARVTVCDSLGMGDKQGKGFGTFGLR